MLTAAHCVVTLDEATDAIIEEKAAADIFVAAGILDANSIPDEMVHPVREIVFHPAYTFLAPIEDESGLSQANDLALLFLWRPVEGLTPVTVISMDLFHANVSEETSLLLSGYGSRSLNGENYVGELYVAETPFIRSGDYEFLAGELGSPDTCSGDSGGPVYLEIEGTRYLVGTTSRARDDAMLACGEGGIYTLAPAYADWITETVALNTSSDTEGGVPTVTTTAATAIARSTATIGGNVTSEGGASVTARGVCWSRSAPPTTEDTCTEDGTGAGDFTSSITGLSSNTEYSARAYATNVAGTAYGSEVTFTTSGRRGGGSGGCNISALGDNKINWFAIVCMGIPAAAFMSVRRYRGGCIG